MQRNLRLAPVGMRLRSSGPVRAPQNVMAEGQFDLSPIAGSVAAARSGFCLGRFTAVGEAGRELSIVSLGVICR